jgi:hypothetical protein
VKQTTVKEFKMGPLISFWMKEKKEKENPEPSLTGRMVTPGATRCSV